MDGSESSVGDQMVCYNTNKLQNTARST